MMKVYNFDLPWPPTVNHFHQPNGRGGITKSNKAKKYQRDVIMIIRSLGLHKEKIKSSALVTVVMKPKTNARYDVSNFLKAYEDGLVMGGFLEDDHWIEYEGIYKSEKDSKNPRINITVRIP